LETVVALEFDTRHAPRRAAQYLELVKAIRSASDADETDWLEWKSQLNFRPVVKADKSALAHVARAIVGFANRQPDEACRNVEGKAFFVVGVDPLGYYGTDEVDGVDLDQQITPLVGEHINWWPTYVHVTEEGHERLPVLVITVDPPQWGDPIACVRKQIQYPPKEVIHEASIFVRRWGQTDRARAADIDRLGERLQRGQQSLDVDVTAQTGGMTPLLVTDVEAETLTGAERERLMKPFEGSSRRRNESTKQALNKLAASALQIPDGRSREEYEAEVEAYLQEYRAALTHVTSEAASFVAPRLALRLSNRLDTHLEGVQVRLILPEGISALLPQFPAHGSGKVLWRHLPDAPRVYGPRDLKGLAGSGIYPSSPWQNLVGSGRAAAVPYSGPVISGGTVVFPAKDVRVRLFEDLQPIVLVREGETAGPAALSWTATATNMDGEASGRVMIPVLPSRSLTQLLEETGEAEG
jgi:hypothetical protein